MADNFTIRKNWVTSFELMVKRPIIILPFFIIAFLEGLALELIYFSTRKPISLVMAPIIRKFSGEPFLHYPFNLVKLPKYFYYSQALIYIIAGVFLIAISINILKNIKMDLPLKAKAFIRNAANRYFSFATFGIIMMILIFLLNKLDAFLFSKLVNFSLRHLPQIIPKFYSFGFVLFSFFTNIIMQAFLVLALPIIVIKKKSLLKAIAGGIAMGFRNFFGIFTLIFLPFMVYLPIMLLRAYSSDLAGRMFPEISVCIMGAGIVVAIFVECFVVVCAAQFLLEKESK